MRQNNKADMTITEQFESIRKRMCDIYCKKPQEYLEKYEDPDEAFDMLQEEECSKCPMGEL